MGGLFISTPVGCSEQLPSFLLVVDNYFCRHCFESKFRCGIYRPMIIDLAQLFNQFDSPPGDHIRHYVDYAHASALNCGWSAISNRLGKSNTRPSAGACLNDGSSIARLVRFGSRLSWQLINQRPHVVCSLHQIELGLQIQPELRIHSEPMP